MSDYTRKNLFVKGHSQSNTGKTHFKKGHTAWNKGIKQILGDKHGQWKGDNASYMSKHRWIYRHLGQPQECSRCGTSDNVKYNWHNISGKYLRAFDDWERLCTTCHGLAHRRKITI